MRTASAFSSACQLQWFATDNSNDVNDSEVLDLAEYDSFGELSVGAVAGTSANIALLEVNARLPMCVKVKKESELTFHGLKNQPDKVEDIFVVLHYSLGDKPLMN